MKKVFYLLSFSVFFFACKKDTPSNNNNTTPGQGMFWVISDLGLGSITVTCNGSTQVINSYYSSGAPSCGSSGCANFSLPAGTYPYTAVAGSATWSGTITILAGNCSKIQFTNSGGSGGGGGGSVGQGMFWVSSDLGVGSSINVTCNGITRTITSYYSSGSPACGSSGCANFSLNAGTYSYSGVAGSSTWTGTITISAGGCSRVRFTN